MVKCEGKNRKKMTLDHLCEVADQQLDQISCSRLFPIFGLGKKMCKIIPVLEKSRGVWGRVERRWSRVQQKEVKVTELLQAEGKGDSTPSWGQVSAQGPSTI